jgi:hypothetical protein
MFAHKAIYGLSVGDVELVAQPDRWRLIQGGASNAVGLQPDKDLKPLNEGRRGFKPSIEVWADTGDVVPEGSSLYVDV